MLHINIFVIPGVLFDDIERFWLHFGLVMYLELKLGPYLGPLGGYFEQHWYTPWWHYLQMCPRMCCKVHHVVLGAKSKYNTKLCWKISIFSGFFYVFSIIFETKKDVAPNFGYVVLNGIVVSLRWVSTKKKLGANPLLGVRRSRTVISGSLNKKFWSSNCFICRNR